MAHVIQEDREQAKKETGASLMFIGLAVWVADALVAFFFPSAVRIGRQGTFLTIILVLAGHGFGPDVERLRDARQTRRITVWRGHSCPRSEN